MASSRLCSIPDCGKTVNAKGLCLVHYQRWRRNGDPLLLKGRTPNGEARRFFFDVVLSYAGDDCLIWPYATNEHGYGVLTGNGGSGIVSRQVCEHVYGAAPTPKHDAAHSCGKGHLACVAKRHLSWRTRSDNHGDKIAHGTSLRGSKNHQAKLTEADVREMLRLREQMSQHALARKFGVSVSAVNLIMLGRRWAWVTP